MEATATLRHARVSARKARLVADVVRGQPAAQALDTLQFLEKKTAPLVARLIESAIANAEHAAERDRRSLDIDTLFVKSIFVDQGRSSAGSAPARRDAPRPSTRRPRTSP